MIILSYLFESQIDITNWNAKPANVDRVWINNHLERQGKVNMCYYLVIPGNALKLIIFFYDSAWNAKLQWFGHLLIDAGNLMLLDGTITIHVNAAIHGHTQPVRTIDYIIWTWLAWAYLFHNYQISWNAVTEIIIVYNILTVIKLASTPDW